MRIRKLPVIQYNNQAISEVDWCYDHFRSLTVPLVYLKFKNKIKMYVNFNIFKGSKSISDNVCMGIRKGGLSKFFIANYVFDAPHIGLPMDFSRNYDRNLACGVSLTIR